MRKKLIINYYLLIHILFIACHSRPKKVNTDSPEIKANTIDTIEETKVLENLTSNDKTVKLEKIIFHTTGCWGYCPTYHLQIDSTRNIDLYSESVYLQKEGFRSIQDSTKIGYFNGKLPKTKYDNLIVILESMGLDTLKSNEATCCDGSIITLIIYYNGRRMYIHSMFPGEIFESIILSLYDICEKSKLQRIDQHFEIEGEKASR